MKQYISTDGGITWEDPITTIGLPSEKAESFIVMENGDMIAFISKHGIYRSVDGGYNWSVYNNNMPVNPEKTSEYDSRILHNFAGKWYNATKKQGMYVSDDFESWTQLKTNGLESEALDVWSVHVEGENIYIAGKRGVWKTNMNDSSDWVQMNSSEGRQLIKIQNDLYFISKSMIVYRLENDEFVYISEVPSSMKFEDPKCVIYADGMIYMSNKKGLAAFSIPAKDIANYNIELSSSAYTYDGKTKHLQLHLKMVLLSLKPAQIIQ